MFASLVLLMAAAKKEPIKTVASIGHIANLKQSILETFVPSKVAEASEDGIIEL